MPPDDEVIADSEEDGEMDAFAFAHGGTISESSVLPHN